MLWENGYTVRAKPRLHILSLCLNVSLHKDYFVSMGLSEEEAGTLHRKYYREYGLALRGLVRHHGVGTSEIWVTQNVCWTRKLTLYYIVDPLDFDRRCDGSLPLEDMIKPDPAVQKLLQDINRTKFRMLALTNAYVTVRSLSSVYRWWVIHQTPLSSTHNECYVSFKSMT